MLINEPLTISFNTETDTVEARDTAAEIASGIGLDKLACAEVALAVSEIVGNASRYAGKGDVIMRLSGNKKSLEIVVRDRGPGIKNISKAMAEGYSSMAVSLGVGLNAAKRAMDEFSIKSKPGNGTSVMMKKYLPIPDDEIEYGIISLNDERYPVNGDAYVIKEFDGDKVLLSVIDGAGNGYGANQVANFVKEIVEKNYKSGLKTIVNRCHISMRKAFDVTDVRICAMGLLLLKPRSLEYLGVGDTSIDLMNSPEKINLFSQKGMVGDHRPPNLQLQRYHCGRNMIAILCSDGIRPRFTEADLPLEQPAQKIANFIMENYRQQHGDATVLVAKRME